MTVQRGPGFFSAGRRATHKTGRMYPGAEYAVETSCRKVRHRGASPTTLLVDKVG